MEFLKLDEILSPALKGGYAVPAFNFWSFSGMTGAVDAAEVLDSPVIIQAIQPVVEHYSPELVVAMLKRATEGKHVPVALHLDHGTDAAFLFRCVKAGFSSVMFDASSLPYEQNVEHTREVVSLCHMIGMKVESEIGHVGSQAAKDVTNYTDPEVAERFANATGVDALAISVGTSHSMPRQNACIRFDIIDQVASRVAIPLVLHGSSGVADCDFARIASTHISKINIGTALGKAYLQRTAEIIENKNCVPFLPLINTMEEESSKAVEEVAEHKIELLKSNGKAILYYKTI